MQSADRGQVYTGSVSPTVDIHTSDESISRFQFRYVIDTIFYNIISISISIF